MFIARVFLILASIIIIAGEYMTRRCSKGYLLSVKPCCSLLRLLAVFLFIMLARECEIEYGAED